MKKRALLTSCAAAAVLTGLSTLPALADGGHHGDGHHGNGHHFGSEDSRKLQKKVTVAGIRAHQQALQAAANANGGIRASGTPGFDASAAYVKGKLEKAGYTVTVQPFDFPYFEELTPAVMQQTQPNLKDYVIVDDYFIMSYSASGDVTAVVQNAGGFVIPPTPDPSSTSGCDPADFNGFVPGNIALIQRGGCTFAQKVANATAAGASAAIVFNEGNPGRTDTFLGTLGAPVTIPVLATSFAVGAELAALASPTIRIKTDTLSEIRNTANLIAEKRRGGHDDKHPHPRSDKVLVVGAHLDSVNEGPGIHDNGSGSATNLEIALQMRRGDFKTRNIVRFAWWGAEESGLLGSEFYVASLSDAEKAKIFANLNFDMIASPNAVRFIYDGDGSDTPDAGPDGSATIEQLFIDYFAAKGLANKPTAFDGRSDYGPFIDAGIPAGGLFTGAEGLKTAEEAAVFGGEAGIAYDICYHQACDDINNVGTLGLKTLDEMSDAVAHSVITLGNRKDPLVPPVARAKVAKVAKDKLLYKGGLLQR